MLITIAKYVNKVLPDGAATSMVRALAAMTQRPAVSVTQQEAMARASKLHFGEDQTNVAWSWGEGRLLILVHGWGGRADQMAPLAVRLAAEGFRAVALDVTGHGASPKRHTRWEYFLRDIAALTSTLKEDVYAYVAHSAGALCVMADRELKGIRAQRYVCIAAPSHPFPPIHVIQKKLRPKQNVIARYKEYIAAQFGTTWEKLETGRSYADAGSNLLLIYDETDRFVSHTEGDRIHALCPGSTLIKTKAYSHQQSVEAPETLQAVVEFLKADHPAS